MSSAQLSDIDSPRHDIDGNPHYIALPSPLGLCSGTGTVSTLGPTFVTELREL